jgi:hypothetical protein
MAYASEKTIQDDISQRSGGFFTPGEMETTMSRPEVNEKSNP